jgi:hypothetical protein
MSCTANHNDEEDKDIDVLVPNTKKEDENELQCKFF